MCKTGVQIAQAYRIAQTYRIVTVVVVDIPNCTWCCDTSGGDDERGFPQIHGRCPRARDGDWGKGELTSSCCERSAHRCLMGATKVSSRRLFGARQGLRRREHWRALLAFHVVDTLTYSATLD